MALFLRLDGDTVIAAKYQTYGCGVSIASGSMLTEMIVQRRIADCLALTAEQLTEALEGVPPDKLHCPVMAIAALRDALKDG